MEPARFDQIVSAIYQAGSGVGSWERVLAELSDVLDLWVAQIIGVDKVTGTLMYSLEGGPAPPEATIDYIRKYHDANPRLGPCLSAGPNEWVHCHELFDEAFVASSPFYQDFLIPHGGRFMSALKLIDDDSSIVMAGAFRGAGSQPLGKHEISLLDRLSTHLTAALKIYAEQRARAWQVAAGHHILERMGQPVVLLNEHREIQFANRTAIELLATSPSLFARDKLLVARRPTEDRQLLAALKSLLSVRHETLAVPRQVLRLESTVPDRPMMLVLDKLLPVPTMQAFGQQPMALAILHDLSMARAIDPFIVAEVFNLTPAEAQVSVLLASGLSPEQIADKRHVSTLTVRTQLRSVHAKIGVSRQADLVRLIREMPALGPDGTPAVPGEAIE